MKYTVTHLKSGRVSTMTAEQVQAIQENGFGAQFKFEALGAEPKPEIEPETTDKNEPEEIPKGKKSGK